MELLGFVSCDSTIHRCDHAVALCAISIMNSLKIRQNVHPTSRSGSEESCPGYLAFGAEEIAVCTLDYLVPECNKRDGTDHRAVDTRQGMSGSLVKRVAGRAGRHTSPGGS